jgi:hypothetical protein
MAIFIINQMTVKYSKMTIKYTSIFHSNALQNLLKLGFLVCKQTIWQPCFPFLLFAFSACYSTCVQHFLFIERSAIYERIILPPPKKMKSRKTQTAMGNKFNKVVGLATGFENNSYVHTNLSFDECSS